MHLHLVPVLAALAASAPPEAAPAPVPADGMVLPLRSEEIYAVPPQFAYPMAALREEIEGRCTVSFTIDEAGVPQDILPICTHGLFVAPARDGVAAARLRIGGTIAAGGRFRLPLSFRLGS